MDATGIWEPEGGRKEDIPESGAGGGLSSEERDRPWADASESSKELRKEGWGCDRTWNIFVREYVQGCTSKVHIPEQREPCPRVTIPKRGSRL